MTIARHGVLNLIAARPEPVIVLRAPAGMGKSVLLAGMARAAGRPVHHGPTPPQTDDGPLFWDLGENDADGKLDEALWASGHRLVIAGRPDRAIPGLDRALAYGMAWLPGPDLLLFTPADLAGHAPAEAIGKLLRATAGWPVLVDYALSDRLDDAHVGRFLEACVFNDLSPSAIVALAEGLSGRPVPTAPLAGLFPLVIPGRDGRLRAAASRIARWLRAAARAALARQLADPDKAAAVADAYYELGEVTRAIRLLQEAGQYDLAHERFVAQHGLYYIYRHGTRAFDEVLAGFPEEMKGTDETLLAALCLQSLKHGDVDRARHILSEALGPEALDYRRILGAPERYSLAMRHFRLLMLIYEDFTVSPDLLDQSFRILSEIPAGAHLERGSFYNVLLEFYIRLRRYPEAEEIAARAKEHYRRAEVPQLEFYIALHEGLIRLILGDAVKARRHVAEARRCLESVDFASANDNRLLKLLDSCIEYEQGRVEPLALFLSGEFEEFSHGEIWPSLVEFALHYGSQALSEHFSTISARHFLERWRVYQVHNNQFQTMIDIREAIILQNGNRWQEAANKLAAIPSPIDQNWVLAHPDRLAALTERDDIALALAWLRHALYENPLQPRVLPAIMALRGNLNVMARQHAGLDIWLAYVYRRARDLTKARHCLQGAFERAVRLDAVAPLAEERHFLSGIIDSQRVFDFLDASPPIRAVMRRLRDFGLRPAGPGKGGLTRQETKAILLVAQGSSNKHLAQVLGLSEATVKFHLSNAFRKLGCRNRREAVAAARALGLVAS